MEIVRRTHTMKDLSRQARDRGMRVGFVPTMGWLHEGHLTLIRKMNELTDVVVVSIFVNPTQFGPTEDFDSYPRDLTRDADLCIAEGVDYLFTPRAEELYSAGPRTWVDIPDLSTRLEGASRPGHFRGVSTVVLKLLHAVEPQVAAFGQKDAQQAVLVRRMVADLMLDVEIVVVPTVRDDNGLALSSRNQNLSEAEYRAALAIPRALEAGRHVVREGQTRPEEVVTAVREVLEAEPGLRVDYVEIADPEALEPVTVIEDDVLLLVAAYAGDTRLLDNTMLAPPSAPPPAG